MVRGFFSAAAAVFAAIPLVTAAKPPFGLQIYRCTTPGLIAPAFDDGPWIYSEDILDRFQAAGIKATWFLNGANKGSVIYNYNSTVQRMIALGHQVGSHGWQHLDMATLTADQLRSQMTQLETALTNILGYFPYYMRPPFLSVNAGALATLRELEYNVVIGDLNTEDWSYQSAAGIEVAKQKLVTGLDAGGTIIEAHDQEEWTHGVLIDFMIATIVQRGLTTVTIAECLGDPNPYRTSRSAPGGTLPPPAVVYSLDGTCGNQGSGRNLGYTCPPTYLKRCCSKYGNCGATSDYCAPAVCQSAFGECDASAPSPSSTLGTSTTTTQASSSTSATGTPSTSGTVTPDGTCGNILAGKDKGYVCKPGQCCSRWGNCGTTSDYCAVANCQPLFGICQGASSTSSSTSAPPLSSSTSTTKSTTTSSTSTASTATPSGAVTPDGTCGLIGKGANNGYICKPGQCCSRWGNCGATSDYCAPTVCQPLFGTCASTVPPGTTSPDGTCGLVGKGNNIGYVCPGTQCCSKYGSCGTTVDYCAPAVCQSGFGKCNAA